MKRPLLTAALFCLCSVPTMAQRGAQPEALPAGRVLTNLRSVSGRSIFLLVRGAKGDEGEIAERVRRMAAALSARSHVSTGHDLWVVVLTHPRASLNIHRHGSALTVSLGEPTSLPDAPHYGVLLRPELSDEDHDQEILLQAKSRFRERESTPAGLVTLAQGAAVRQILRRYASGDVLGAHLTGGRHLALVEGHPDARLVKQVLRHAEQVFDVEVHPLGPAARAEAAPPAAAQLAEGALAAGEHSAQLARKWLKEHSSTEREERPR